MNKEWSELNKKMQVQISKEKTFDEGKKTLLELRNKLFECIKKLQGELSAEDFSAMPFINADGYHSKSIAYSLWHIFRIEDIVANDLIQQRKEILFSENFVSKIKSPLITTGNELVKNQIAEFSKKLDIQALYEYCEKVKLSTEECLKNLSFKDLKTKYAESDKERIKSLKVVSNDENAIWLIDYWCNKNIKGLIQMPFSRHWIMHVEAILRIEAGIRKVRGKK